MPKLPFVTVTLTVLLLGSTILTSMSVQTYDASAYSKKNVQTESLTNTCGDGDAAVSVLCQNLASEIQGDKNALNMIGLETNGEISEPLDGLGFLIVIKKVICPDGSDCSNGAHFVTMTVEGSNPSPSSFPGSPTGTQVTVGRGPYSVDEILPEVHEGIVIETTKSSGCSGSISAGQTVTCIVVNKLTRPTDPTVTVMKHVVCPDGFTCPDPSQFNIEVSGTNPFPTSLPGSETGTQVILSPGTYSIFESEQTPPNPTGLILLPPKFSPGCTGTMVENEHRECIITNEYRVS